MPVKIVSEDGVELDQEFGDTSREVRAAEESAEYLARITGSKQVVRRGREVLHVAEARP